MSSSRSLTSIDVSEYDRIEAAMSESERGRWFLQEYLSRNRAHDTGILLDAIGRLESAVTGDRDGGQIGRLRGDVMDMAHAIARTKAEIAAIHAPDHDQSRLGGASAALDAIVLSTERATSDILGAAEQVQEAAWTLRESGSDAAICDELDRRATAIYTACSFQDLTAQRTARIVYTLRYLEDRLASMIAIWGSAAEPIPPMPGDPAAGAGPQAQPSDLCQSDIDRYIAMEVPAVTAAALVAQPGSPPLHEDIVFVPVSDGEGSETVETADPDGLDDDADAEDGSADAAPAEDWADLVAASPEPAAEPDGPILSFAAIDALPPEQRLALFA